MKTNRISDEVADSSKKAARYSRGARDQNDLSRQVDVQVFFRVESSHVEQCGHERCCEAASSLNSNMYIYNVGLRVKKRWEKVQSKWRECFHA